MLVSIIVPAYNCEKTIIRCLESLSEQTYKQLEIIVVDDGSEDGTLQIIEEYSLKENRLRVITQKNGGPGFARNTGLRMAYGKYFAFVDADDTVEATYIECMVREAELNQLDLTICKLQIWGKNKKRNSKKNNLKVFAGKKIIMDSVVSLIKEGRLNSPVCKLYRLELQKKYQIFMPVQIDIGEDLQFNLLYIQYVEKMGILDLCLYNYNILESGLTKKYRKFEYDIRVGNIRKLEEFVNVNSLREEQFIYFLYLKLMFAECINMSQYLKRKEYFKRIGVLLSKNEIRVAIERFTPEGLVQKILYWGCKTYDVNRIHKVVKIIKIMKKIVPGIKRASV